MRGDCERMTHTRIDQLCETTASDALKVLDDYKVVLEDADALWRRSHPDLNARFPKR